MQPKQTPTLRLIDRWAVIDRLGISESTLERMMVREVDFPQPRRISSRSIRWLEHEVDAYSRKLETVDYFGEDD
ncbi:helix-turn-helix transcriptional regulator [Thalassorhabdomicrobium marinisediminis]|uniref:AlpA family phage regulatory protein n=1 Tax=Thalassorhabdomicrobium marinisediminis TaxID=2170577 RepID=A0A2T7FUS3_9RHOB|nr:AlpA family phage regulatory protein [Thalassorhabdomicrobium marinisediminis]PVA05913.1 hypothetical protein DC363_13835 [Thalassorhabdomicrobium marinisediminis]